MKITEVIKECRAKCGKLWGPATDGQAIAYGHCAYMLTETVREIRKELSRVKADAKNGELNGPIKANAEAMAVILEWVLEEKE